MLDPFQFLLVANLVLATTINNIRQRHVCLPSNSGCSGMGVDERRTFAKLDGSIKVKRVRGAP
jgi:hypothetical protein